MNLITKIQAAARGLNTRTSLTNFFKACPPSGRTADLFLSRVYGGHEGGRRRGGGYVVDFIYCLRSTRLPLPFSEALARFPLEIYNLSQEMQENDLQTDPENHLHPAPSQHPYYHSLPPHSDE